ncbi:MAG: 50S ribosomal protein L19 [Planctomycetes bacterium]|jgi:large subunit ribosomal protein L19|nr:50S ribosomal protein L19 [Planctomycetota bacterium]
MHLIQSLEKELGKAQLPNVQVGDSVEVHYLIKEGEKERIQLFIGTVIALRGRGIRRTMTVRRIVQGEGVERVFPLHSPRVKDVVSSRRGETRRSKLYFLRDRVGKRTRLKEVLGGREDDSTEEGSAPAPAAPTGSKSKAEKVTV